MVARTHILRRLRPLLAAIVLLLPAVAALAIGQGRLQAEVVDAEGKPVADVQVLVTQDDIGYRETLTTNRRGRFTLMVVDATRVYTFELSKEGMPKVVEPFKIESGGVTRHTFVMVPIAGQAPSGAAPVTEGRNKAINIFNEGVMALQAGDKATARAKFEETIALDADMPQPYSVLSGLYLDAKEYDLAIASAEKLLELSPDDPAALLALYDAHHAKGETATAQQYLDRLSAAGGGTDAAVRVFNAGADAVRAGDLDTAVTLFSRAIAIDPELVPAHVALARLELARGRHAEALVAAEAALGIDPGQIDAQRVRYAAYRALGQEDKAAEAFALLAESDPEGLAEALYEQGKAAFESGDSAGALTALEQAVEAQPDHARAHYMLGLAYANSGDSAKAKQHLEKFVELAPDDPEVDTAKQMLEYMG